MYSSLYKFLTQFDNLTEAEWTAFESILEFEIVKKGTLLADVGVVSDKMYFINCGALRLFFYKDGEERTGNFFFENELASPFISFTFRKPNTQLLETIEDCELFSFSNKNLTYIFDNYPIYNKIFRKMSEFSFAKLQKQISMFVITNPEERYEHLFEHYPQIIKRAAQKDIASFLGITPVSLSRLKKRLYSK